MAKLGKRAKKFQRKHLDAELRRRKTRKIKKQRDGARARRAEARKSDEGASARCGERIAGADADRTRGGRGMGD
jgi:hypothetical protein